MPPPLPKKVLTPGSYGKDNQKEKEKVTPKKTSAGRPTKKVKKKRVEKRRRESYTQEDVKEAIRLVREEEYSIAQASLLINNVKKNVVPRMTLSDRLKCSKEQPELGRPQELPRAVEEALVECLIMCSEFQYPMKKSDLKESVHWYCLITVRYYLTSKLILNLI
jgi:hypothetical protein